jgi:hypothetical protein
MSAGHTIQETRSTIWILSLCNHSFDRSFHYPIILLSIIPLSVDPLVSHPVAQSFCCSVVPLFSHPVARSFCCQSFLCLSIRWSAILSLSRSTVQSSCCSVVPLFSHPVARSFCCQSFLCLSFRWSAILSLSHSAVNHSFVCRSAGQPSCRSVILPSIAPLFNHSLCSFFPLLSVLLYSNSIAHSFRC